MFEIGQRVKVIRLHDELDMEKPLRETIGRIGVVQRVWDVPGYDVPTIQVFIGPGKNDWWTYYADELEAVDAGG